MQRVNCSRVVVLWQRVAHLLAVVVLVRVLLREVVLVLRVLAVVVVVVKLGRLRVRVRMGARAACELVLVRRGARLVGAHNWHCILFALD